MLLRESVQLLTGKCAQVVSFYSWCGGLPAPECADNPLGYKFSWSPRGVLLAALNGARFLEDGALCEVAGEALLRAARSSPFSSPLNLEGLPNRDSTKYISLYGLDRDGIQTMFRGTLRYAGFCRVMAVLRDAGLLDVSSLPHTLASCKTWVWPR